LSTLRAPSGGTAEIIAFVAVGAVEKFFLAALGARFEKSFDSACFDSAPENQGDSCN
jgi:hypothetical protein